MYVQYVCESCLAPDSVRVYVTRCSLLDQARSHMHIHPYSFIKHIIVISYRVLRVLSEDFLNF